MGDVRYTTANVTITDVSTAEIVRIPITPGLAGELKQIRTALQGAITVANSKLTVKKNTTVLGTITIAYSGSGAGIQDYMDFNNVYLSEGDAIVIDNDGGSTDAARLDISASILI